MRRKTVSIGNIVIPQDVDREKYVQYALRTHSACVVTEHGDFIKNCPIATSFCGYNDGWFNAMTFPPNNFTLGTQVVLLNMQFHDIPIIIGTILPRNEASTLTEEYQVKVSRRFEEVEKNGDTRKESYFEIEGKGLKGIISLIADSTDEDGGKILLDARNDLEKGKIAIRTNYLTMYGNKQVDVLSDELIQVIVKNVVEGDEFTRIIMDRLTMLIDSKDISIGKDEAKTTRLNATDTTTINAKEIKLGDNAKEGVPKGDSLDTEWGKLMDAIGKITVPTAFGASGVPINSAQFTVLKTAFKNAVLSTISKVE